MTLTTAIFVVLICFILGMGLLAWASSKDPDALSKARDIFYRGGR